MRIISGKYKEDASLPKRHRSPPTTDMSKEALFNVINNHFSFEGLKILDLFAGTGNISYEFASEVAHRLHLWTEILVA
jgi:16S rRNA G966 N2-methylase RsmD